MNSLNARTIRAWARWQKTTDYRMLGALDAARDEWTDHESTTEEAALVTGTGNFFASSLRLREFASNV